MDGLWQIYAIKMVNEKESLTQPLLRGTLFIKNNNHAHLIICHILIYPVT